VKRDVTEGVKVKGDRTRRPDRVTLVLTYAMACLGLAAALLHLSLLLGGLLAAFITLGAAWDLRGRHPLSTWMINLFSVMGVIALAALPSAHGFLGRLLAASVVLLGAKLLGPKASRDHLQVMLLSLLLLIGSAILTVDLTFGVLFAAYLPLATATLLWIPFGRELEGRTLPRGLVRRLGGVALVLLAAAIPLTTLFYFGLPRATAPLWHGIAPSPALASGFSDRVSLGDVGRIALRTDPVFRAVLLEGKGPLPAAPYWRGLVFEDTDGVSWRATEPPVSTLLAGSGSGETVRHLVYLEPQGDHTLFALDHPLAASPTSLTLRFSGGAVLKAARPPATRFRYEVESDITGWVPEVLGPEARARNLFVPPGLPPAVHRLASDVVGPARRPQEKVERLRAHFHTGYTYTTQAPVGSDHPLEAFLTARAGYCEYFAAATAMALRLSGVPARLVGGYVGGEFNDQGNYYLVRQRSAHVWVEAYIDGRGWMRVDPTPPAGSPAGGTSPASSFSRFVDSLRLRWYALTIGYDMRSQVAALRSLSETIRNTFAFSLEWENGGRLLGLAVLLAAVPLLVSLTRKARQHPLERLYAQLLRRLSRRRIVRGHKEGPLDFARRASRARPEGASSIMEISRAYAAWRYGGRTYGEERLRELSRNLRRV
jgi:transglutaminase-like putative cysteine protease